MSSYANANQLYQSFEMLFERLQQENPNATKGVKKLKLIIRFNCSDPAAQIIINGRGNPVEASYGSSDLKPDLDISLSTDTLHCILLGKTGIRRSLSGGKLKVKGPVWKSMALADIFNQGQTLYPLVLQKLGLPANC